MSNNERQKYLKTNNEIIRSNAILSGQLRASQQTCQALEKVNHELQRQAQRSRMALEAANARAAVVLVRFRIS